MTPSRVNSFYNSNLRISLRGNLDRFIPKPHKLRGGTSPDIADANRSVVSLICSSEVGGLVVIGVDCVLVTPNVLGGTVVCIPAAAVAAGGAVTTGDPGW